jgi:hypothetical protein
MKILQEIKFSPTLSLWKSKFDLTNKDKMITACETLLKDKPDGGGPGHATYYLNNELKYNGYIDIVIKNALDTIMYSGIKACIELHNKVFNEIKMNCWVNIIHTKNPEQNIYDSNDNMTFHNHVDLNAISKLPTPLYTFVCYIQVPDNLSGDDGVLFIKDVDDSIFSILPNEGEILIMKGDLPHVPNYASNSTKDRIVLAGSIRMDFIKLNKTLF